MAALGVFLWELVSGVATSYKLASYGRTMCLFLWEQETKLEPRFFLAVCNNLTVTFVECNATHPYSCCSTRKGEVH